MVRARRLVGVRAQLASSAAPVRSAIRRVAATPVGAWVFARTLHHLDRLVFRLTRGQRTATATLTGLPVVMLTTTGRQTGLPRTVPVLGIRVGEDTAVAAGHFGRTEEPGWCRNLRRNPAAEVTIDGQRHAVVAEELSGDAYDAVWRIGLGVYPGAAAYARRAGRDIAVFLLRRPGA
jgi:deazaflavin-dependent oxidoreductase (nitroreductase family)